MLERDRPPCGVEVSGTGPTSQPDLPPPHRATILSISDSLHNVPPTRKDPPRVPLYDDVILNVFQPSSSAVPSTPMHHADTPPKLPPPRASTLLCGSETPQHKLPPSLYDEVLPKGITVGVSPDSPFKLPSSHDEEASLSDTESPPPLPPPYRDSVVLSCTPLYDEVLPKEVTDAPTGVTLCNQDSPPNLPPSRDGEAFLSDTDLESPPPLPPPYRNSAFLMPVYDDVIIGGSPANQTSTESNAVIQDFASPFLNCDAPPPVPTRIYQDIAGTSA